MLIGGALPRLRGRPGLSTAFVCARHRTQMEWVPVTIGLGYTGLHRWLPERLRAHGRRPLSASQARQRSTISRPVSSVQICVHFIPEYFEGRGWVLYSCAFAVRVLSRSPFR
jgi:hypothetical protein